MPTPAALKIRRYAERLKQSGSVSMTFWAGKDLSASIEKCRGDMPRAAFIRHALSEYLTWHEQHADQMDLPSYLSATATQKQEAPDDVT